MLLPRASLRPHLPLLRVARQHLTGFLLMLHLLQVGAAIDEDEMNELFQVSDMSGRGVIDYEEFIAAMLDSNRVAARRDAVRHSFEQLDRDGDGYISVEDLAQVGGGWL